MKELFISCLSSKNTCVSFIALGKGGAAWFSLFKTFVGDPAESKLARFVLRKLWFFAVFSTKQGHGGMSNAEDWAVCVFSFQGLFQAFCLLAVCTRWGTWAYTGLLPALKRHWKQHAIPTTVDWRVRVFLVLHCSGKHPWRLTCFWKTFIVIPPHPTPTQTLKTSRTWRGTLLWKASIPLDIFLEQVIVFILLPPNPTPPNTAPNTTDMACVLCYVGNIQKVWHSTWNQL